MGENANTLLNEEECLATHKVPNPSTYLSDHLVSNENYMY